MPDEKRTSACAPALALSTEQLAALDRARQRRVAAQEAPAGPWLKYQQQAAAADPWAAFPEVPAEDLPRCPTLQAVPAPRRIKPLEEYRFEDCVFYMGYFH